MTSLQALLQLPRGWLVVKQITNPHGVSINLRATRKSAHCPECLVQKYPEIQVVSRDRGGIYAMAARDGAPQARQVADRWHLLKNIGDALERMMFRHMPLIRHVATEL